MIQYNYSSKPKEIRIK